MSHEDCTNCEKIENYNELIFQRTTIPNINAYEATESIKATCGFTSRQITFPPEGMELTVDLMVVDGYSSPQNSNTQLFSVPRFKSSENQAGDFSFTIRQTTPAMFREQNPNGPLETMASIYRRYETFLDCVKLGNRKLEIKGIVQANTGPNCKVATNVTSGDLVNTPGSSYTTPDGIIGSTVTDGSTGKDFGYWIVHIDIPPTSNFDPFILPKGSIVPPNDVLYDKKCEETFDFLCHPELSENNVFNFDFVVDSCRFTILKTLTTNHIRFLPNSNIPKKTRVYLGHYIKGTNVDLEFTDETSLSTSTTAAFYEYDSSPQFSIKICGNSDINSERVIHDGDSLPPGFSLPQCTTTNTVSFEMGENTIQISDAVVQECFVLPPGMNLINTVPDDEHVIAQKGSISATTQLLPEGSKFTECLDLHKVSFPPESTLESNLIFKEVHYVNSNIDANEGSLFRRGTELVADSMSLEGARISGTVAISAGTTLTDNFRVCGNFDVLSSADLSLLGVPYLYPDTILKGCATLPPGFTFTSGNKIPAHLDVSTLMGVTFDEGFKINPCSNLDPSFTVYGNCSFGSDAEIPAGSALYGTQSTFSSRTCIPEGSSFSVRIPAPLDSEFKEHTCLPKHTQFTHSAKLPCFDPLRQTSPLPSWYSLTTPPIPNAADYANPDNYTSPTTIPFPAFGITQDGRYLVLSGGTILCKGTVIQCGSIISTVKFSGYSHSIEDATYLTADPNHSQLPTIELDPGTWSQDPFGKHASLVPISLIPGIPIHNDVYLYGDVSVPHDLFIPVDSLPEHFTRYLRMNETFELVNEMKLLKDYKVRIGNSLIFPPYYVLPFDFCLKNPWTFSPLLGVNIIKTIKFHNCESIKNVISDDGHLVFPGNNYKIPYCLKLAVQQPVSSTAAPTNTGSGIRLVQGTTLNIVGTLTLLVPMSFDGDFRIDVPITNFPKFSLPNGIFLTQSTKTPGDIVIKSGCPLPGGIVLPNNVKLCEDYILCDPYTLKAGSTLSCESYLSGGTYLKYGLLAFKVHVGRIHSLAKENSFTIYAGEEISTKITYPQLVDSVTGEIQSFNVYVYYSGYELNELHDRIEAMEMKLSEKRNR
jgi:hypothetical protein